MKGMQKIKRGKQFEGAVLYVLKPGQHHKCVPYVIGGNLVSDMATELIEEFNLSKQMRPDIQKAVWHNALRLPQGEKLCPEQWKLLANDYMQRMGFSDTHLRCYVLHDDAAGQHIHIIASRIDVTNGKLYLGRNENLISTRIISELEIAHGLTVTKTASSLKPRQPMRKKLSRNEEMLAKRTKTLAPKQALQGIIEKSLTGKPDLNTFIKRLEDSQVTSKANIASTGKMNGFSFEYQSVAFKASQLGKMYSWSNLQKHLNCDSEHSEAVQTDINVSLSLLPASAVPELPMAPVKISPVERQEEPLTISEKIASLNSTIVPTPTATDTLPVAPTPALTSKTVVKEDKRQQILNAVFDLQNAHKIRKAKHPRFSLWLTFVNLLKIYSFYLIHSFRKFKSVLKVHTLTPAIQTQFTANLKRQK
ncbi:relaxase/mobilization nuclease domain-containing protein [Pectobacterium atrosepticum]|uniref:relaxase/mobilization nuclease domain-containing protein n=1 Tax=Pectobacterium atrosepticum TaxID=29471 RepID=UPI000C2934F9|nr:relaxase/mobilization nuclease domain-containing protein [Pectobacterium atrosepticum]ATY89861.1 hypothetical protein CVS35_05565 [Pectobacterium atrosepticum]MCA6980417.1 relaxase/mobilization nuclease domain-containing protein [Pectobacterium atrosepticum]MCH5021593.1 relaxase/mobilization nuclease domain-containing protein [Pectobacterium atrosepticum]